MKLHSKNLFSSEKIIPAHWEIGEKKLPTLLKRIEERKQGFYSIFEATEYNNEVEKIKKFTDEKKAKFTDIVLCGIGGSALGALVLQQTFYNAKSAKLHVMENIDPDIIHQTCEEINIEKTLFIFISKSGGTAETLSQYLFFSELLEKKSLSLSDHIVTITGKTGFLREETKKHNFTNFSVPENIGGRFSVLTSVGLLPACLLGIDIDELIAGAKDMANNFLETESKKNISFQFALACYLADEPIHVFMPYSSRLKNLGFWYAQLLAESTGKDEQGYTLLPALGATDQHSQLQLFSDGPKDKLVIFLEIEKFSCILPITQKKQENKNTQIFENISFQDLINTELKGTRTALQEKNVSNITLSIPEITPYHLGQLFLFLQCSTAFIGEMLGINTFNQPGVERSKIVTRELLQK